MLKIGLTGGIASGKSTVSDILRGFGALVFDADKEAHVLLEKNTDAYEKIKSKFQEELGFKVIKQDGSIDRKLLGDIVFFDKTLLGFLEDVMHRQIEEKMNEFIESAKSQNVKAVILDIPLLIEKKWYEKVDKVWLVYVSQAIQLERLKKRESLNDTEAKIRLYSQINLSDKLKHADLIIDNSGNKEETFKQVQKAWEKVAGDLS